MFAARAAENLRTSVTIAPSGDDGIDSAISGTSTLVALQGEGEVSPLGLLARARADAARFTAALRSLGHYDGQTHITIAGVALETAGLPDQLAALPEGAEVAVTVAVTPGPVTTLRHITVTGDTAGLSIDLAPGQPAIAARVLAAGAILQAQLLATGHAFARVDPPVADLDPAGHALDVSFDVNAGPRVEIGTITVSGETGLDAAYVNRRLTLKSGTMFDPAALEAARADLARVPAIANVRLLPAEQADAQGRLPIMVQISERLPRVVSVTAGFSTDQGGFTTISWTHRNLWGAAELLTLNAGVTDIGASAAKQPGYRLGAALTVPDWRVRDQSLTFTALAVRESLDAYDRTATIVGAAFGRRLGEHLTASAGVAFERAYIVQAKIGHNYTLFQTPLALRYDSTDSLIEPTHGIRADAVVTPTFSLASRNTGFAISQVSGAAFFDLADPGRTVLALRAMLGTVSGATTNDVPPDQRFYAGGSGTVRGYRYQSLGPQLSNGKPLGGTAMAAGTIELRQRIGESWGMAMFADAGQASSSSRPFSGKFQIGLGIGARYYTSIGAIRVDVAMPTARPKGGDIGELYVGLGQAF